MKLFTKFKNVLFGFGTAILLGSLAIVPASSGDSSGVHSIYANIKKANFQPDGEGQQIVSEFVTDHIAPGITEKKVTTNSSDGNHQNSGWIVECDVSNYTNIQVMATYKSRKPTSWGMSTVRSQMNLLKNEGYNVVAGFNSSIYNMSTGEPTGVLVMDGTVYHEVGDRPFFAVMKDGSYRICEASEWDSVKNDVQEAFGGFWTMLKDGNYTATYNTDSGANPRTAIGIKADGTLVFVEIDGRQAPYSEGIGTGVLADLMLHEGCVDAINLDGGGSSTYIAKSSGGNEFVCRNRPSDGNERTVSAGVAIISKAAYSGEFDHPNISPDNEVYTPGSTINLSYKPVDASGGPADIKDGQTFTWGLEPDSTSLGTIDANTGVFTSNGTEGTLKGYLTDGKTKWSFTEEIRKPTELKFMQSSISLGFSKQSDLGLEVTYKGREVHYKDGDFKWTLSDEKMGSFNGNIFTSSDRETVNGTITVEWAGDSTLKATIEAKIGQLPTIVEDFEKHTNDDGTVRDPLEYYADDKLGTVTCYPSGGAIDKWLTGSVSDSHLIAATYDRGETATVNLVGIDETAGAKEVGPVRFGSYALKLNYDFTTAQDLNTEGACVGFPTEITIPGTPTGLGVWVYSPEGTPDYWFRLRIKDGDGNNATVDGPKNTDFTDAGGHILLNTWTGWKYVEFDLSDKKAPITINAGEMLRVMRLQSNPRAKGVLYYDDIKFVYGANNEDLHSPIINYVNADENSSHNYQALKKYETPVFKSDDLSFEIGYQDYEEIFARGVDPDLTRLFIDGEDVTLKAERRDNENVIALYGLNLPNGIHSLRIAVYDKYNNETVETYNFIVARDNDTGLKVSLNKIDDDSPHLGGTYTTGLYVSDLSDIQTLDTKIAIPSEYSNSSVSFATGFTGTSSYDSSNGQLVISIKRDTESGNSVNASAGYLCRIVTDIPYNSTGLVPFSAHVDAGTYTTTRSSDRLNVFGSEKISEDIKSDIAISVDPLIIDSQNGYLYAKDTDGKAIADAKIYDADSNTELGITDDQGRFDILSSKDVGRYHIYANKDGKYSFSTQIDVVRHTAGTSADDGKPYNIHFNATENGASSKNISWTSDPVLSSDSPKIRIVVLDKFVNQLNKDGYSSGLNVFDQKEFEKVAATYDGKSTIYVFNGSADANENYGIRINAVNLSALESSKTYLYQVGDGTNWSDIRVFTTAEADVDTNFFIIGDTQGDNMVPMDEIAKYLTDSGLRFAFGIQEGDSMETVNLYSDTDDIIHEFSNGFYGNVDVIHVLGNHEFMGDDKATYPKAIYNLPEVDGDYQHYSVDYGNVHVMVLNFSVDRDIMEANVEWIKKDAKESKAMWKILVLHQPPYYTNTSGNNDLVHELIPAACDEAGIDIVFSGHDHSYARTPALYKGEKNDAKGTVYFITGSTGEKAYPIENTGFPFDAATQEYKGVYLIVKASGTKLVVEAHDTSDNHILDSYTMNYSRKEEEHDYRYDPVKDKLVCVNDGFATETGNYSGLIKTTDDDWVLFENGVRHVGDYQYDASTEYYFDKNGIGYTGNVEIEGIVKTFTHGLMTSGETKLLKRDDGYTYYYVDGNLKSNYWFMDDEGNVLYAKSGTGQCAMNETVRTRDGYKYQFDGNCHVIKGEFTKYGNTSYHIGGDYHLHGWLIQSGKIYYFGNDNQSFSGTHSINGETYVFQDKPDKKPGGNKLVTGIVRDNGFFGVQAKGDNTLWIVTNTKVGYFTFEDGKYRFTYINGKHPKGKTDIGTASAEFDENGYLVKSDDELVSYYVYRSVYKTYDKTFAEWKEEKEDLDSLAIKSFNVTIDGKTYKTNFMNQIPSVVVPEKTHYHFDGYVTATGDKFSASSFYFSDLEIKSSYVIDADYKAELDAEGERLSNSASVKERQAMISFINEVKSLEQADQESYEAVISKMIETYNSSIESQVSKAKSSINENDKNTNGSYIDDSDASVKSSEDGKDVH